MTFHFKREFFFDITSSKAKGFKTVPSADDEPIYYDNTRTCSVFSNL